MNYSADKKKIIRFIEEEKNKKKTVFDLQRNI